MCSSLARGVVSFLAFHTVVNYTRGGCIAVFWAQVTLSVTQVHVAASWTGVGGNTPAGPWGAGGP